MYPIGTETACFCLCPMHAAMEMIRNTIREVTCEGNLMLTLIPGISLSGLRRKVAFDICIWIGWGTGVFALSVVRGVLEEKYDRQRGKGNLPCFLQEIELYLC